jgi:hypothetical protein
MSIGLGIFLSSLCLGTIALYGITKDRWNWRRIGRNISLGLLVIAIAGAGVYFWNDLPTFILKQNEYAGLRLGMTQEEVQYIKGHPPTVLGEAEGEGEWKGFKPNIATTNLEKGKRVEDYQEWSYDVNADRIDLDFGPAKTGLVVIECYSSDRLKRCPAIAGITDGNTEQEVIKKFGRPDTAYIEGVAKFLYYKNIGVHFWLAKEQVYMIGINDTRYGRKRAAAAGDTIH